MANARQIKLGAVLVGVGNDQLGWRDPEVPGNASVDIHWFIENARLAEESKFDFVFMVDSPFITPDTTPHFLNRLEPLTLLSALAVSTSKIGLIATLTSSYWEPYNVARLFASLDNISDGRAGWNVVTTGLEGASRNYGREEHFDHAVRYRRAHEFVEVVRALSERRQSFVGSPKTVADEIERWFVERAADGFNLHISRPGEFKKFREQVVPILQKRGLFKTEYFADTLRGHLGLPVPENRWSAAQKTQAAE